MLESGERCPLCTEGLLELRAPEHEITIGGIRVKDRTARVLVCASCGESLVSAEERRGYERRAAATILRERTEVPGSVVRVARRSLGLTQRDLAALLGGAAETVSRWENGKAGLPRAERLAIVACLDGAERGIDIAPAVRAAGESNPPQPVELEVKGAA